MLVIRYDNTCADIIIAEQEARLMINIILILSVTLSECN